MDSIDSGRAVEISQDGADWDLPLGLVFVVVTVALLVVPGSWSG